MSNNREELLRVATQLAAGYGSYCSDNNIAESEVNIAAIEQAKDLIQKVDAVMQCDHEWISGDNEVASGSMICTKCNMVDVRGDHE